MACRWIAFAAGAVLLAIGAWYLGRPVVPVQHNSGQSVGVATASPASETPQEPSRKVIEVIDLARAYEPVRDVESPMPGGINPASFIEEQYAPARIPYAVDQDKELRDVLMRIREMPFGSFLLGVAPAAETIDIKPRDVTPIQNGLLNFVPAPHEQPVFTPMGVPFSPGIEQIIPPNAVIQPGPVRLDVMPREVATIQNGLIDFVPTPPSSSGQVFTPMGVPFPTGITQPIPPNASIQNGTLNFTPYELLKVIPREVK